MDFTTNQLNNFLSIVQSCDEKSIEPFGLFGRKFLAKCVNVYDGDTFTALMLENEIKLCKISVRLSGIDTPEIKSSNNQERQLAQLAKDILCKKILDQAIWIEVETKADKYGRILAQVYNINPRESVNQWMLKNAPCNQYDGKKKQSFDVIH
jgi:micrococcal nuclease